ncbi:OOP family OmpA-OmpF porin [Candidatus Kinetoplastibacterium desouzaii TCC079E]|uniref:OOP family OmpA-OmpF porin n=1 Tax=Candidatus Kinetoplastidibacterium desouzai TCC079E TaxID=1208919 RepID=M1L2K6_9PROT|nr:OmpA family protein [Candidatus Kinetoplastibacterium desouzaii]AGF46983.1 OOP family OmpA-OmpF porin [Candidatus Kinetoplastibacterium desouzaii TCC079E]
MSVSSKLAIALTFTAISATSSVLANETNHLKGSFGHPLKNGTNELVWRLNNYNENSNKISSVKAPISKNIISERTFFDFDKHSLKESNNEQLDKILLKLKQTNLEKIVAYGYTDSKGNPNYNKKLSGLRAESVKKYFISKGIDSKYIVIESKGSDNPIATNNNEEGRAQNRRVEIKVFAKN